MRRMLQVLVASAFSGCIGGGSSVASSGEWHKTCSEQTEDARLRLVWSDEFDGHRLDPSKWVCETGFVRNREPQWYCPENASIENGCLVLEARRERVRNPNYRAGSVNWQTSREVADYTSASVKTLGRFEFRYGRLEVRAKLPKGISMWPAVWTLGVNQGRVGWPKCGEIDMMEYWGLNEGRPSANIHWYSPLSKYPFGHYSVSTKADPPRDVTDDFHVYQMDWTETHLVFRMDGGVYARYELSKFDLPDGSNAFRLPHYLIMNLALTGKHKNDENLPSHDVFPQRLEVDYVRIYEINLSTGE